MKYVVLALFLASACAPAIRHPAPYGFFNVQCEPVRKVLCVPDGDMSVEDCGVAAREAVAAINEAVGRPVLEYGGAIPAKAEAVREAVNAGRIPVWVERLPDGILGVTGVRDRGHSACIRLAFVRLAPGVLQSRHAVRVMLHELIHALGGGHATPTGLPSLMTPSISDANASAVLTPGDRAALAQVYGRD